MGPKQNTQTQHEMTTPRHTRKKTGVSGAPHATELANLVLEHGQLIVHQGVTGADIQGTEHVLLCQEQVGGACVLHAHAQPGHMAPEEGERGRETDRWPHRRLERGGKAGVVAAEHTHIERACMRVNQHPFRCVHAAIHSRLVLPARRKTHPSASLMAVRYAVIAWSASS